MKKYDDNLEKILTAVFGGIGTIAIIIKLYLNGITAENIMDAVKDIASLIVVIAVFLLASKIFKKEKKLDFAKLFESHLKEWINQNNYLVCENFDDEGKGKLKKRYCSMVIDHANILTRKKLAKDATPNKEKGAFVYLPFIDDTGKLRNEFEFRFNQRTFERQTIYRKENGEVDLNGIIGQIALRIDDNFKDFVDTKSNLSKQTITVSFEKTVRNEQNAKKLIDIVEFVKTLTLAIA